MDTYMGRIAFIILACVAITIGNQVLASKGGQNDKAKETAVMKEEIPKMLTDPDGVERLKAEEDILKKAEHQQKGNILGNKATEVYMGEKLSQEFPKKAPKS
jgi:hypothetical protein